jgi:hypothetical protein
VPEQEGRQLPAVIQIECRDTIGHPSWNRDFCETHARPVLKGAELRAIAVSWR